MTCKNLFVFSLLLFTLLNSCNKTSPTAETWQFFAGRDNGQSLERPLIYRAHVPPDWIRQNPLENESIIDTTKAICEFHIEGTDSLIRVTIHTFPILKDTSRIPPLAQINRWKGQFEEIDLVATQSTPSSRGGFNGLFFEGMGLLKGIPTKVMGWSMQLASIYERQLSQGKDPLDQIKRADYTIKVVGSPDVIDKHRLDILRFANSFELIDELPAPS